MRTIQKMKKNPWFFVSTAQLLSLLMVLGIGGCKGCGKDGGNDTTIKLSLVLSKDSIVDHEKVPITIKNEAEKISDDEPGNGVSLEKVKLMVKFLSGGTGSQFVYDDETGAPVKESEINRKLDKFKGNGNEIIYAQETESVNIGVEPGPNITSAEFQIDLVVVKQDGTEELMDTKKITWTAIPVAELVLVTKAVATSNTPGKFAIRVNKADIKPSDIQVEWTSDQSTVFELGGQAAGGNVTLRELLAGNDNVIKVGDESAEIQYQITANPSTAKQSTITLKLKKDRKELLAAGGNQLAWHAKDLNLALKVSVIGKEINYTVEKKGTEAIEDATDQIELVYEKIVPTNIVGTNKATLTRTGNGTETKTGTIALKAGDFVGATPKARGGLTVDLQDEDDITVKFTLTYNGIQVATETSGEVKRDIQLQITGIDHDRTSGEVKVKIKNNGTEEAKEVELTYTTTSNATIGGQKTHSIKNTIPAGGAEQLIDLGVIDFQSLQSAEFTFTVSHGKFKVDEKKTFTTKDLQITWTVGDYDPAKGTVEVEVKNTGADAVDNSDNLELVYSLDKPAEAKFKSGALASVGNKNIDALAHNGKEKETLTIDLKDAASSELTLQLKLGGNDLGAPVTKECKEEVQLSTTFVDQDFTGEKDLKIKFDVKNAGKNDAAQKYLQVKLIRKKGKDSTINGQNPGPNDGNDILLDASQGVEHGQEKSILELALNSKTDEEVEFLVQLFYRGSEVAGTEKRIVWNKQQKPQLAIVSLKSAQLEGKDKTFNYKLKNTGTGQAEIAQIKLKVTNKSAQAIKIGTVEIQKDNSVELTGDKIVGSGNLKANNKTGNLELLIDPQTNAEVSLTLEPTYDTVAQGNAKTVTWKVAPLFNAKFVWKGDAKAALERLATITLTNVAGRDLTVDELKMLKLTYNVNISKINYNKIEIRDKTLEQLNLAKALKNGDKIEFEVTLVRKGNKKVEINNLEVKKGKTSLMKDAFVKVDWEAVPKITLTPEKDKYASGEKAMKLTVETDQAISDDEAKKIIVKFATDNPMTKKGELKLGTNSINAMTLYAFLGNHGINAKAKQEVDNITFEGVTVETKFTISLEGPVELAKEVLIKKKIT